MRVSRTALSGFRILDEPPDAGADGVQAEVNTRVEVQDDGFPVELAKDHVVRDAESRVEGGRCHVTLAADSSGDRTRPNGR